jgi:tRNA(Ser,Leu) C12 N-acetylase TAN1
LRGCRRPDNARLAVASFDILATSLEGRRDALLVALRRLGRFRPGGYRNVVVGSVEERDAFLDRVAEALARDPLLPTALARLLPIDHTLRFTLETALDDLAAAAEPLVDRLEGDAFFVRLERRGMKGRLHTPTLERDLADRVWRMLEARGRTPRVDFRDPDGVLVVETLGDQAGIVLLPRALRARYPFVRIR